MKYVFISPKDISLVLGKVTIHVQSKWASWALWAFQLFTTYILQQLLNFHTGQTLHYFYNTSLNTNHTNNTPLHIPRIGGKCSILGAQAVYNPHLLHVPCI